MIEIRPGMHGNELPTLTDVTQEDINFYLDPEGKDVPELRPDPGAAERERLEGVIRDGDETAVAMAKAKLAYAHLMYRDPSRARDLAHEAATVAQGIADPLLLAESHCGLAQAYCFPEVESQVVVSHALEAEYLYHDLGKPYHEAMTIWFRMMAATSRSAWSAAADLVHPILELLKEPGETGDGFRFSVYARVYTVLHWMAVGARSSLDLQRRCAVLAVVYARAGEVPLIPAMMHATLGNSLINRAEYALGRAHYRRAYLIYQRIGAHNDGVNALCGLAVSHMKERDFASADMVLNQADTVLPSIPAMTRYPAAMIVAHRAILAIEQGQWDEAERLLHSVEWRFEESWRGSTAGLLELQIRIYRGKGTLHEHLDVYDRLFEEMKYSAREQASAGLETIGLQKKLREIDELREVDSAFKALLPAPIYREFRSTGEAPARFYPDTAIFFSDFVGFTKTSSALAPRQVMEELTDLFANFDRIMAARGCERIETIGDAYVAVSGLATEPEPEENGPAVRLARAALDIQDYLGERNRRSDELGGPKFQARIGLHVGGIIGGIVGRNRIRFGIFGDAVNTTQRLEAACRSGGICASRELRDALAGALEKAEFSLIPDCTVEAKGKGPLKVWYVERRAVPSA